MKAMCLNCKHFDAVLVPYCKWCCTITNPESICDKWESNQTPKETPHV